MLHYQIYFDEKEEKYYIEVLNRKNKFKEIFKEVYLKAMFNSFWFFGRNKRLGKSIELLVENKIPFNFSEYDMLLMIKILYVHKYNIASGKFLIDYYKKTNPEDSLIELKKIINNY